MTHIEDVEPPRTEGPRIGIALGGGAARGWAHIGVLERLEEAGITPSVVTGTSIGAVVGAAYAAGKLDGLKKFALSLNSRRTLGLLDLNPTGTGLINGRRLARLLERDLEGVLTQNLPVTFAAIAAELKTGHEFWLSEGPLVPNVQASYALPGIFPPVLMNGRWLIDGAVVNPIPVSTARAKGARVVIAVNLTTDAMGRGAVIPDGALLNPPRSPVTTAREAGWSIWRLFRQREAERPQAPGIPSVMIDAYNIIQDRITRARLAGDPPDAAINPKVGGIGLYEFYRAKEAIALGRTAVERAMPRIEEALELLS